MSEAPVRARPSFSIVLPVHDEADSLPVLWDELLAVLPRLGGTVEVIFVDDGSTDASADILRGLVKRAARGEIVATMDSDLQNDPADLEVLLQHLDGADGADAAVGARLIRHDSWL